MSDEPQAVVEVHYALLADLADPALQRAYQALLSPDEQQRLERLQVPERRLEYLCTRALARTVLAAASGLAPEALRFSAGAHGKPELLAPAGQPLAFNLSNTAGLVACAVAQLEDRAAGAALELGLDVEAHARRTQFARIARRFFAPAEVEALLALPEADQRRRFFEFWTLKESYIKARGLGLALPLRRFSFQLAAGAPPRIDFAPGLDDQPGRWRFAQFEPTGDHLGAVALSTPHPLRLHLRRVVPLRPAPVDTAAG